METVTLLAKTLGILFTGLRERAGLSQKELAAKAGVSETIVRNCEGGAGKRYGLDHLTSLSHALGLDCRTILFEASRRMAEADTPFIAGKKPTSTRAFMSELAKGGLISEAEMRRQLRLLHSLPDRSSTFGKVPAVASRRRLASSSSN